ncbi:hypothetical protein [Pendulispora albinea]|uniref:Triacylglycerol lipase n=1 Tax=Pendulispora albinea TaxID=2741071 RepID=A0ABZ2M6T8_9BACT
MTVVLMVAGGAYRLLGKEVQTKVECAASFGGSCGGGGGSAAGSDATGGSGLPPGGVASSSGGSGSGLPPGGVVSSSGGGNPVSSALSWIGDKVGEGIAATGGMMRDLDQWWHSVGEWGPPKSWAEQMGGSTPSSLDNQMAKLANDVYEHDEMNEKIGPPIDGWTRMSDDELAKAGINPTMMHGPNGFHAEAYRNRTGNVVVAIAGTDSFADAMEDMGGAVGMNGQVNQGIDLGRQFKKAFGDNVACTGHSLGGGVCGAMALVNDMPGATFNAMAVNMGQVERGMQYKNLNDLDRRAGNVRAYELKGDPLTGMQNEGPLAVIPNKTVGTQIPIKPVEKTTGNKALDGFGEVMGLDKIYDATHNHSMDTVVEAMDRNPPWIKH